MLKGCPSQRAEEILHDASPLVYVFGRLLVPRLPSARHHQDRGGKRCFAAVAIYGRYLVLRPDRAVVIMDGGRSRQARVAAHAAHRRLDGLAEMPQRLAKEAQRDVHIRTRRSCTFASDPERPQRRPSSRTDAQASQSRGRQQRKESLVNILDSW